MDTKEKFLQCYKDCNIKEPFEERYRRLEQTKNFKLVKNLKTNAQVTTISIKEKVDIWGLSD